MLYRVTFTGVESRPIDTVEQSGRRNGKRNEQRRRGPMAFDGTTGLSRLRSCQTDGGASGRKERRPLQQSKEMPGTATTQGGKEKIKIPNGLLLTRRTADCSIDLSRGRRGNNPKPWTTGIKHAEDIDRNSGLVHRMPEEKRPEWLETVQNEGAEGIAVDRVHVRTGGCRAARRLRYVGVGGNRE